MGTPLADTDLAPSSDRTDSGSTGQKRWLLAILVLALLLRLWRLEQNGFGTDYYSASTGRAGRRRSGHLVGVVPAGRRPARCRPSSRVARHGRLAGLCRARSA